MTPGAPAQVELPAEGSRSCVSDGGTTTAVTTHCGDLVPRQEASAATMLRSVGCDVPTLESSAAALSSPSFSPRTLDSLACQSMSLTVSNEISR